MQNKAPNEPAIPWKGLLYKIGVHGKVFRWSGIEWILSTKTPQQLEVEASRQQQKQMEN